METLTEFLLARIAEDEARAVGLPDGGTCWECGTRVRAECESKRQIVHEFVTFSQVASERAEQVPLPQALTTAGIVKGLERALGHLAALYADHPAYRQEWKP